MKYISILLLLLAQGAVAQISFDDARAYQIQLREIKVLAVVQNYGPANASAEFFSDNGDEKLLFGYPATEGGRYRQKVGLMRLDTKVIHNNFSGSTIRAISPDGTRVLLSNGIYDLEKRKLFKINVRLLGMVAWLDDDKIYTYDGIDKYPTRMPAQCHYVDLNDLQAKTMTAEQKASVLERIKEQRPSNSNFFLSRNSRSGSIYISDKKTPYMKTLVPFKNGYPIQWYKSSSDLKYIVVMRSSEYHANSKELVLYELKATKRELTTRFIINNPSQYFSERFKKNYDEKGALGIWADVYEAKIKPLNDKKIGANKNTFKASVKVVEVLRDGRWIVEMGYHSNDIISGCVATNFRRDKKSPKDTNGAWTTLIDY